MNALGGGRSIQLSYGDKPAGFVTGYAMSVRGRKKPINM